MSNPPDEGSEDGRVLSPEELDIADDDSVVELDEGRFVIGTDDTSPPEPDPEAGAEPDPTTDAGAASRELDDEAVHEWLVEYFERADSRYGFDVTARFDDSVRQQQLLSNDVVTAFENLVLWYAQQVGDGTPVEEVVGILLLESNVPIQYPTAALRELIEQHGLEPEDSIAELLDAVGEEGFRFR